MSNGFDVYMARLRVAEEKPVGDRTIDDVKLLAFAENSPSYNDLFKEQA